MKTADGQIWAAREEQSAAIKKPVANKPLSKYAEQTIRNKQQKPTFKMRPTQVLVSKNEGNTLSSWLRDIATICLPLYMLYMLATHPLIKGIGQPHNRKMTKTELHEKFLHEYNQKLQFGLSVRKNNFLVAVVNRDQCYEFPTLETTAYMPRRSALFKDRYKKWVPQKGSAVRDGGQKYKKEPRKQHKKVKGFMQNARKKMIPR